MKVVTGACSARPSLRRLAWFPRRYVGAHRSGTYRRPDSRPILGSRHAKRCGRFAHARDLDGVFNGLRSMNGPRTARPS